MKLFFQNITSTVNVLTGYVPPSRGNALVMGRTVAEILKQSGCG